MAAKDIQALISLIDDPDLEIFKVVEKELLDQGATVIEMLEKAWETAENELSQVRIESIIQKIQFTEIMDLLYVWKKDESRDLLKGAFIIAKFQYPDLQYSEISEKIELIKKDVWLELNENLTALEKIKVLNHIIFDLHKFSKSSGDFYAPGNSYINLVLDTKKGNPISMGILYAAIAQQLNLPVFGVNLPKNFILAYRDEHNISRYFEEFKGDVLFYINPYNKGGVFGRREIDYYIRQLKLEPDENYYLPCDNVEVIRRLIITLLHSYEKTGYNDKVEDLRKLFEVLKSQSSL
ncbi:MAG: transglutaminase-like domain-containing protein [Bacteroidota bacterium]